MSNNKIDVKVGMGVLTYTKEELEQEINDLYFLRDAFLIILNPEVTGKSDLYLNKVDAIKYAKEMYDKLSYNQDFIDKCFSGKM